MNSKVSFTIRRPAASSAPAPRHVASPTISSSHPRSFTPHAVDSSDEDDEEGAIEAVTGFDQSGVQRLHEKPKPSGPLVIPALANRDWRAVARLRKQQHFIPDGAAAPTGKDGSQGGLGTRDSINSGPQAAGLMMRKRESKTEVEHVSVKMEAEEEAPASVEKVESEDERARRALLASVAGGDADEDGMAIDAIPMGGNNYTPPMDETDAYKQDVVTRPESASLADYERVPVSQFGAALLRGMGWKEGTAASRTRRGLVEPWLPTARPSLLGIGAKERPAEDLPATGNGGKPSMRPERRYVPVVKLEREGSERPPPYRSRSRSPGRSGTVSRVASKSASPYPSDKDRRRDHRDSDKVHDNYGYEKSGRSRGRDRKDRERDSDRNRDRRKERGNGECDKDRKREPERDERSGRGGDYRREDRERSTRDRETRY